jgi:predicted Zn-dependent protease
MGSRFSRTVVMRAIVVLVTLTVSAASAFPQDKKGLSNEDINAIGHRNVGNGVNFYSLEQEKKLGAQLAAEVERSSKPIDDSDVIEYLNRVGQKIAKSSDARFPITIRVIDSESIDAFTLPGGLQYINKGLILQTEGEAELAGVLAHGIAHTAMRSATMEATKGELMQLATIPLIILGPGGWSGHGTYEGLNLSIPVTYLKSRRDAETAADYFGLQYLYKAGYDPEAFVRFIERVLPQVSAGKTIPKVFSPFPPLTERVQNMRKEIAKILPLQDGAIVSSCEFESMKEHLRSLSRDQNEPRTPEDIRKPKLRKLRLDPDTVPVPHTKGTETPN